MTPDPGTDLSSNVPLVLVLDHPGPDFAVEAAILSQAGIRAIKADCLTGAELSSALARTDAIMTALAPVTSELMRHAPRLKSVTRSGVGVDNIDVEFATSAKVTVTNVPDYCTDEVAEHTMALLLAAARRLVPYDRLARQGAAQGTPAFRTTRLKDSRLGIVGFGRIGRAVAQRAAALRMEVVTHDPAFIEMPEGQQIPLVPLEELLSTADFITIHAPLTEDTHGLIGARQIAVMKPTAWIINVSRPGVVDEIALKAALATGSIAGACLDVYESCNDGRSRHFADSDRVILTPHIAFYSEESLLDLRTTAAQDVVRILRGAAAAHCVNPEVFGQP